MKLDVDVETIMKLGELNIKIAAAVLNTQTLDMI